MDFPLFAAPSSYFMTWTPTLADISATPSSGPAIIKWTLLLILAVLVIMLYVKLYHRLFRSTNLLGYQPVIRLLNFAVAAFLFPVLLRLLLAPARLLSQELTYFINQNTGKAGQTPGVTNILSGFWRVFMEFLAGFTEKDLGNIAVGIFAIILLRLLVDKLFYDSGTGTYNTRHLTTPMKSILTLAALLLISSFFWLASIIAIPYIQAPKTDASYSLLNLDSLLHSYTKDTAGLGPLSSDTNASASLNSLLSLQKDTVKESDWTNKAALGVYNENIYSVTTEARSLSQGRADAITHVNQLIQEFTKKYQDNIEAIKLKYQSVDKDLSPGGERDYYIRLADWFRNFISFSKDYLANLKRTFTEADKNLAFRSHRVLNDLPGFKEKLRKIPDTVTHLDYLSQYFDLGQTYAFDYLISATPPWNYSSDLPDPLKPGADWSFIGTFASWLIAPHSIDVILIVGMLGFGMFGASLSTVIVQTDQENVPTFTGHLMRVVLKGFAAAIIVFLASKAGIAAFNNGSNEPNPYVLFFTCMAGAVFSDRIWEWVKNHLLGGTGGGQNQNTPT